MTDQQSHVPGDRRVVPSKGDRQRRAILDALPGLLRQGSFARLSIGRLAQAAGLSRSGFYFYFDSKETVLAVALAEAWQDLEERNMFFRDPAPGDSRYDHVRRSIAGTASVWQEHAELLVAFMEVRDTEPVLEQMWAGWMGELAARLAAFLGEEVRTGRADLISTDLSGLSTLLLDLIAGTLYRTVRAGAPARELSRQIDLLARFTFASIWGHQGMAAVRIGAEHTGSPTDGTARPVSGGR